ncbi:MAG: four helix bundle protein, partial [Acidimicrobiia bacterium]
VCALAARLRTEIVSITATRPVSEDPTFCTQIRSSAGTLLVRIAECADSRRDTPARFTESLAHARAALHEMTRQIERARKRALIAESVADRLGALSARTTAELKTLQR